MVVDTTLTFAQRRHVPTRYSRDLVAKTLNAMQRVEEIRRRRERVFYNQRMAGNKERQRAADRKLVEENQHLLPPSMRKKTDAEEKEEVFEEMDVEMLSDVEEEVASEEEEKVAVKVKASRRKQKVSSASMEMDD
jgi:large subunit ribosomal protein L24e